MNQPYSDTITDINCYIMRVFVTAITLLDNDPVLFRCYVDE